MNPVRGAWTRRPWLVVTAAIVAVYALADRSTVGALVFGLAAGALVAAIAVGVVLTYTGSGVINFAAGASATLSAYVFYDLRTNGNVMAPPLPNPLAIVEGVAHQLGRDSVDLPSFPTSVSLGGPWPFWAALFGALVISAAVGLLVHLLIFRVQRDAPVLAKVVASVGLMTMLHALVIHRYGVTPRSLAPVLSKRSVTLPRGILVPRDQLIVVGIVVLVTIAVWIGIRYTRIGIATRAAAENEKGAVLLGYSPNLLAGLSWVLSTVVMGLFGILLACMNTAVDPDTIVLMIVPALAAALVGGFTSFGVTLIAALFISMAQSVVQDWSTRSWFPKSDGTAIPGLQLILPLLVIIVYLVVRGRGVPDRKSLHSLRLPYAPSSRSARRIGVAAGAATVGLVGLLLVVGPLWRLGIINSTIAVITCSSLVILTGWLGQISLAQMTLAGFAGFVMSKLMISFDVPFPLAPLLAVLAATVVGAVVALPALRIRGVNLAIVTLSIAVVMEQIVLTNPALAGSSFGASVPPPRLGDLRVGPADSGEFGLIGYHGDGKLPNPWFGVFCVLVMVGVTVLTANLRRSGVGRRMLSVRVNERAAAAAGVSLARTKLLGFAIAAFVAGIGGVLLGYFNGTVTPQAFGVFPSIYLLVFAYLGGITSVGGAYAAGFLVAGGVGATMMAEWAHVDGQFIFLLGGIGLVVTAVLNPQGIAGSLRDHGLTRRWGGRDRLAPSSTAPERRPLRGTSP